MKKRRDQFEKLKKRVISDVTTFAKNIQNPNEDQIKKAYYVFAFLILAYGMYLFKKEDSKQVSIDDVF